MAPHNSQSRLPEHRQQLLRDVLGDLIRFEIEFHPPITIVFRLAPASEKLLDAIRFRSFANRGRALLLKSYLRMERSMLGWRTRQEPSG